MFELLRESLRQRPDYIIVGEVRGREAYVLFQQMAVGHPGLSTIHADSIQKLIDRLISPPISLPPGLLQNLDIIIFLKRIRIGRKYMRRAQSVSEVLGVDQKTENPITNEIFKWDPKSDKYVTTNRSRLLKKISEATGLSEKVTREELKKRYKVLKWMADKNMIDYRKISYILNLFYTSQEALLSRLEIA
jgi:flagellar protein FlaI